eukprot:TRINITY_DN3829_c0_g1_i1.p1 TRINITY_DN3829_c0_g1~~TRINITY_DN3829_c0_g1_i1.p1  ORF type:complete len:517 (+),score=116.49 TRINITY_DN3829_c0_g1_i1:170-1552(+)
MPAGAQPEPRSVRRIDSGVSAGSDSGEFIGSPSMAVLTLRKSRSNHDDLGFQRGDDRNFAVPEGQAARQRNSRFMLVLCGLVSLWLGWTCYYSYHRADMIASALSYSKYVQHALSSGPVPQQFLLLMMRFWTFFGDLAFFIFIISIILHSFDCHFSYDVFSIVISTTYVGLLLKMLHSEPRPYWLDGGIVAWDCSSEFGYPSTHAMSSLYLFGYMAIRLAQREDCAWSRAQKALIAVSTLSFVSVITFSRVYLGAHDYLQAVAGWIYGALLLTAHIWVEPYAKRWLTRHFADKSLPYSLLFFFGVTSAMIAVAAAIWSVRASVFVIPEKWHVNISLSNCNLPKFKIDTEEELRLLFVTCFCFAAIGPGIMVRRQYAPDGLTPAVWWKRALRYALAAPFLVFFEVVLAALLPKHPLVISLFLRYGMRYFIGMFVQFGVLPLLHIKLGLAEVQQSSKTSRSS